MAIEDRIAAVKRLMDKVVSYDHLITADSFEPDTIDDMKGNAKDICNTVKTEIDQIKAEIDQWS